MGKFVEMDMLAFSMQSQRKLGWHPAGPKLIADLVGDGSAFERIGRRRAISQFFSDGFKGGVSCPW